jgi:exoribonuclease R
VGSEAAEKAEIGIENIYMPEQVYSILPKASVQQHFSLASKRPSMTFSARMNKSGHILESKINPGKIHKVLFFSPAVLQEVVLGQPAAAVKETVRVVGQSVSDVSETSSYRTMLRSHELSDLHKTELLLLHEIGDAHAALLRAKGGVDQNFPPRPKMVVQVPGEEAQDDSPRIQLSSVEPGSGPRIPANQGNLVQSFMLVAAQVAAKWCNDRGIPIPYRVTPRNPAKEDPSEFFIRKVLPSRAENGVAPFEVTSEYLRLIGGVLPSIAPGPHAAVGVDMMARCTSPLRRFTDLLVHWQIGAALLEEARLGQSLVGNTRDGFLPFSRTRVEELLPRIDTREKLIKYGQKEADRQWLCLFLLRAWQYKEAELPSKMPFFVRSIDIERRKVFGMLTDFAARAHCSVPDEINLEEIRVGETLQVELEHINVYERKIQVRVV